MSHFSGRRCDHCGIVAPGDDKDPRPPGWSGITLPRTDGDRRADHERDVCSDECGAEFFFARLPGATQETAA